MLYIAAILHVVKLQENTSDGHLIDPKEKGAVLLLKERNPRTVGDVGKLLVGKD